MNLSFIQVNGQLRHCPRLDERSLRQFNIMEEADDVIVLRIERYTDDITKTIPYLFSLSTEIKIAKKISRLNLSSRLVVIVLSEMDFHVDEAKPEGDVPLLRPQPQPPRSWSSFPSLQLAAIPSSIIGLF